MKTLITIFTILLCVACKEQKKEGGSGTVTSVEVGNIDSTYEIYRVVDTVSRQYWVRDPTPDDHIITLLTELNKKMDKLIELQTSKK